MRLPAQPEITRATSQQSSLSASDSARGWKESNLVARTFTTLALASVAMACLIALLPAAGHDQMWLLYSARLILHGAKLYGPQIFESNPPLIVWLSLIPAAMAEHLHLSATAVGKLLVLALAASIAAVSLRLLKALRSNPSPALLASLAFVYIAVFGVMPARDFGQRDHILALLCLPYVLAAAMDAERIRLPASQALGIGIAAGIGVALKPHQVLIPIAVETTLLILDRSSRNPRTRSLLRSEPLAILACGLAYLLAIHHFAADYFTQVVPVLRDTYWAFGHLTWPQLVGESIQLHILAAVSLAAFVLAGPRRVAPLTTLLLAAGVAATLAYYLQGTGWYYQQLPALSFFTFALTFLAVDALETRHLAMSRWTPKAAAALSLLAVALTTHFTGYPFTPARSFPIDTPDPTFFAALPRDTPVATLTTTVDYTVPPVFKYHLTLAQRYPHLWMLPAILRSEDPQGASPMHRLAPQRLSQLEALQHTAMREDFDRWHPQLVLVERCQDPVVHCQVLEDRHDNLLAWFLRDPAFRDTFSHYHYLRSAGQFDAYVPN